MKRRSFIKISAAALTGFVGVASASGRALYGRPASVVGDSTLDAPANVTLPLSKAQLPPEVLSDLTAYANVWSRALSDRGYRDRLLQSPERAVTRLGLAGSGRAPSNELGALLATWDPVVMTALEQRDYKTYFTRLRRYIGSTDATYIAPTRATQITELIQRHGLALLESYKKNSEAGESEEDLRDLIDGDELPFIAASMCGYPGAVVGVAVVAIVGVAVVTTATVGVNVSVGLNAAVYISVAVEMAVTVSGAAAMAASASSSEALSDSISSSSIPNLSTRDYYELVAGAKAAARSGNRALHRIALKELFRREVDTAIGAAEEIELIHIHPARRHLVVEAATNYVLKTIGFQT